MGRLHLFRFEQDTIEWVSMGLHPDGAVRITTDFDGGVESIELVKSKVVVDEIEIPKRHALADSVVVGKPYRQAQLA